MTCSWGSGLHCQGAITLLSFTSKTQTAEPGPRILTCQDFVGQRWTGIPARGGWQSLTLAQGCHLAWKAPRYCLPAGSTHWTWFYTCIFLGKH